MEKNPILELSISEVMRCEIALPLQQILRIYTVGGFLQSWANPSNQKYIERLFDSPQQARHAVAVFAGWIGVKSAFAPAPLMPNGWWRADDRLVIAL